MASLTIIIAYYILFFAVAVYRDMWYS